MSDIKFLEEMRSCTQKLLKNKYDITIVEHLDKMIEDWIHELSTDSARSEVEPGVIFVRPEIEFEEYIDHIHPYNGGIYVMVATDNTTLEIRCNSKIHGGEDILLMSIPKPIKNKPKLKVIRFD